MQRGTKKLRAIGFKNDIGSGVICQYQIQGIIVDFMPTDPNSIGFSNIWYPEGFKNAISHKIDKDCSVNIFSLPYFIATKWKAFKGRRHDYRTSTDFEDIVFLFENVSDIDSKLKSSPDNLLTYLRTEFSNILDTHAFEEGLTAHLSRENPDVDENKIINLLRNALSIAPPFRGYTR